MTAADMWIEMGEADEPSGVRAKRLPHVWPVTLETVLCPPEDGPERTVERVCAELDVSLEAVLSPDRHVHVAYARQVCAWMLRQRPMSWCAIGRMLGRHHTTIMSAVRKVDAERARNPRVAAALERLLRLDGEREEAQDDRVREAAVQGADPGEGCGEVGHGGDNVPRR
jgi:hypothetical protein